MKHADSPNAFVKWPIVVIGLLIASSIAFVTLRANGPTVTRTTFESGNAGDSLIALWIDSVGGMDRYQEFQSASFTVATLLFDSLTGRLKRNRPRYVWIKKGPHGEETRVERWETYGFIEQGFDGLESWAMLDGVQLPDTAKDAREALYVSRDLFYWMGLPYKLKDPGVTITYRGMSSRPGKDLRATPGEPERATPENAYHAVGVSFEAGVGEHQDVFTYFFEPGIGFPIEVNYVEEGRTNINRLLWGETERAGDIRYPYPVRRDFISESGKLTKALTIYDVNINVDIPQERFEKPSTE